MMKAAFMKIFVNYMNGLMIINSLKLNWNDVFQNIFDLSETVSGNAGKLISFECVVPGILKF